MISVLVSGFLPSACGFHFANDFEAAPVLTFHLPLVGEIPLGNSAGGMCGGMAFAAADLFLAARKPPVDKVAPKPGTPLFRHIAGRLLESFGGLRGILDYVRFMAADPDRIWHLSRAQWPAIRRALDAGRPCPLGLIKAWSRNPMRLADNHQIVAYGYDLDESGDLALRIYDPNEPGDDSVTLSLGLRAPGEIRYSADRAGRGFFCNRYRPADPGADCGWEK
jgi:hypothetical protein